MRVSSPARLTSVLLGGSLALPLLAPIPALASPAPALGAPALPPSRGLRPVPLAALPELPAPNGLPRLQSQVSCPALQQRVATLVGSESYAWSISVADPSGRLLADVNGTRPRVPASNQKLVKVRAEGPAVDFIRQRGVTRTDAPAAAPAETPKS